MAKNNKTKKQRQTTGIEPLNLSAQLSYRGAGNPPNSHPSQAISNCFPGLESDFRNVWRRIFVGLEMNEADTVVVKVEDRAPAELQNLLNKRLLKVDGQPVFVHIRGPHAVENPGPDFPEPQGLVGNLPSNTPASASISGMEWSNALAHVISKAGQAIECIFQGNRPSEEIRVQLIIRSFFDNEPGNETAAGRAVISKDLIRPGELSQSLCSPWQNDYLECACYYWAASRPDYVNVEPGPDGTSRGNNWIQKDQSTDAPRSYTLDGSKLLSYDDLFRAWEKLLKFQIGGKDSE